MKIQVAGPGCARCEATEKVVKQACAELGITPEVEHVYDVREYAKFGVRLTPALLIDGKIVFSGKVPALDDVRSLLAISG